MIQMEVEDLRAMVESIVREVLKKTKKKPVLRGRDARNNFVRAAHGLPTLSPQPKKKSVSPTEEEGPGCVINNNAYSPIFNPNPPKKTFSAVMAKKLWQKVTSENQLPPNSRNKAAWAATFTKMMKEDGRSRYRVRRVLTWYVEHYGERYVPEARCANTFRKKFCQIESAMKKRDEEAANSSS
jgi:hypothetical protein